MHVPFVRLEWRVKTAHANPSFTIRHPVNPIHPVANIDWTGLREEQALSLLPASPAPRHFPSSFPFVRLERRVKTAHAHPSLTIRNTVNPLHPVSNIGWTGLRGEQEHTSIERRHSIGLRQAWPSRRTTM